MNNIDWNTKWNTFNINENADNWNIKFQYFDSVFPDNWIRVDKTIDDMRKNLIIDRIRQQMIRKQFQLL